MQDINSPKIAKATPVLALAAAVGLVAAGLSIGFYAEHSYRAQKAQEGSAQARILAATVTAALTFNDRASAGEYAAALSANPEIEQAAIYDAKGTLFTDYERTTDRAPPATVTIEAPRFDGDRLLVTEAVTQSGTPIGAVYLSLQTEPLSLRLERYAVIGLLVLMAVLVLIVLGAAQRALERRARQLALAQREVEALNEDLERRVADRTSELSRANDEIQRFAYIVSHDLRAPLINIMGFTSELEAGTGSLQDFVNSPAPSTTQHATARIAVNEDLPEAVRYIHSSTAKMDGLINAILKLSREGRRELNPETIDLGKLFRAAISAIQHQVESAGARVELAAFFPTIVSDRLALEQICGNLVDNAVKYLAKDRPGIVSIEATERDGRVHIVVTDNGRGIADSDFERIFELFRRSGPQDRPGDGIGLAHVRALTRRLGGDITVRSRIGEGSSFDLDLPKSLGPQGSLAA